MNKTIGLTIGLYAIRAEFNKLLNKIFNLSCLIIATIIAINPKPTISSQRASFIISIRNNFANNLTIIKVL